MLISPSGPLSMVNECLTLPVKDMTDASILDLIRLRSVDRGWGLCLPKPNSAITAVMSVPSVAHKEVIAECIMMICTRCFACTGSGMNRYISLTALPTAGPGRQ